MNKVLFVIDTLATGGAERSILEIASRFRRYIPVVCQLYPGDGLRSLYEAKGIQVISLGVSGKYSFRLATGKLASVIEEIRPVIVHSTLFRSDIVSRRLKNEFRIPLVNSLVNNSYHAVRFENASLIAKLKLRLVQALDSATLRKVDVFIANSEAIRISNARALNIPLNKIRVIYRGRNIEDFAALGGGEHASLRQALKIGEKRVVLNVSRLLERKGQLDLVRAFARLAHTETILLIAGEGPFRTVLENEIQLLGLEDKVRLLGNRMDVPELLSLADCFVFPSYYEGLPGALIEAMMAGVPIIASRIPENLECVDEESALLFKAGDISGLAECIDGILSGLAPAGARVQAARQSALSKFEITSISALYENLYDELLTLS